MELVKIEELYHAWRAFRSGKAKRPETQAFEFNLEKNLFSLWADLNNGAYRHGGYKLFFVRDPKFRAIHKAEVRDRVVHRWLYNKYYDSFDRQFYPFSFAARCGLGVEAAVIHLRDWAFELMRSGAGKVWVLHCDVEKYFESMAHGILLERLLKFGTEPWDLRIFRQVIGSFRASRARAGLPLGNLTSQLFANVYLHELDVFVVGSLGLKNYLRYNDDFFVVSRDFYGLERAALALRAFLRDKLKLNLPGNKISIKNLAQGVDLLGYALFDYGLVLRARIKKKISRLAASLSCQPYDALRAKQGTSYWGLASLGKNFSLRERIGHYG